MQGQTAFFLHIYFRPFAPLGTFLAQPKRAYSLEISQFAFIMRRCEVLRFCEFVTFDKNRCREKAGLRKEKRRSGCLTSRRRKPMSFADAIWL